MYCNSVMGRGVWGKYSRLLPACPAPKLKLHVWFSRQIELDCKQREHLGLLQTVCLHVEKSFLDSYRSLCRRVMSYSVVEFLHT